jgi:hypothetical protein
MDIGAPTFNVVRAMMVAPTGGAEINECLLAAHRIRDNSAESWIREWAIVADEVSRSAEKAAQADHGTTARLAYMRASTYYRTAMSAIPCADSRFDRFLTLSRDSFHEAAKLFSPRIETVDIPLGVDHMPAYFISAGPARRPTLIVTNGGDSTNEELVHWIGFSAVERGWNCLIFEGPGQMSALQANLGFVLRPDWEVPIGEVVDYLIQRKDVDPGKIALIGYSLGAGLAARAAAFEKRICACISDGLVVDVYEAWHGVWPKALQKAKPATFDAVFGLAEKASPQLPRLASIFRRMHGVSSPSEMIEAWRAFSIKDLGSRIECPFLVLYGEAEYAEQASEPLVMSVGHFLGELKCPSYIHEFSFEDGWAATHCQIGGLRRADAVIFDWLDAAVVDHDLPRQPAKIPSDLMLKHYRNADLFKAWNITHINAV